MDSIFYNTFGIDTIGFMTAVGVVVAFGLIIAAIVKRARGKQ